MYLTMRWKVDEVLSAESDEPKEFDAVPCEWKEPDLDEFLDVSILLYGIKGDRVSLEKVDEQLMCHVRFIVPDDFSKENQEKLVDEVTGGLSDGFGENGLQAQGHDVYLELNLDDEPDISTQSGPTVVPSLAVLAAGGSAEEFRSGVEDAKKSDTFESAMLSTLETIKPLCLAIGSGDIDKVRLLLDAGANANGDGEDSPLESTAIVNAQCLPDVVAVEMAQCLIQAGANVKNARRLAKQAKSRNKPKLAVYFESLDE